MNLDDVLVLQSVAREKLQIMNAAQKALDDELSGGRPMFIDHKLLEALVFASKDYEKAFGNFTEGVRQLSLQ